MVILPLLERTRGILFASTTRKHLVLRAWPRTLEALEDKCSSEVSIWWPRAEPRGYIPSPMNGLSAYHTTCPRRPPLFTPYISVSPL